MAKFDKADIERRMNGAVESFKHDLSGLRTGRANVALLDPIHVEVYGAMMPLNQVATVSAPEARMLSVQVWDKANVIPVEKGIAHANLGLNPMIDGQTIRLPLPDLTEERRRELAKLCGKYAENAKIAIRNVRRDGMEALKEDEKKKEISEDERKRTEDEVQKLTDKFVAEADAAAAEGQEQHPPRAAAGLRIQVAAAGGQGLAAVAVMAIEQLDAVGELVNRRRHGVALARQRGQVDCDLRAREQRGLAPLRRDAPGGLRAVAHRVVGDAGVVGQPGHAAQRRVVVGQALRRGLAGHIGQEDVARRRLHKASSQRCLTSAISA